MYRSFLFQVFRIIFFKTQCFKIRRRTKSRRWKYTTDKKRKIENRIRIVYYSHWVQLTWNNGWCFTHSYYLSFMRRAPCKFTFYEIGIISEKIIPLFAWVLWRALTRIYPRSIWLERVSWVSIKWGMKLHKWVNHMNHTIQDMKTETEKNLNTMRESHNLYNSEAWKISDHLTRDNSEAWKIIFKISDYLTRYLILWKKIITDILVTHQQKGPVQICLNYKASVQKLAQMNHPQGCMKTRWNSKMPIFLRSNMYSVNVNCAHDGKPRPV